MSRHKTCFDISYGKTQIMAQQKCCKNFKFYIGYAVNYDKTKKWLTTNVEK